MSHPIKSNILKRVGGVITIWIYLLSQIGFSGVILQSFAQAKQVCPRKHMASGILAWSNDGENPEMLRLLDFYDLSMEVSGPLTSMDLWQMRETFCF